MANGEYRDCSACGGAQASALLHGIPSFVLAFMVFIVFEHHSWGSRYCPYYCLPAGRGPIPDRKNYASPACSSRCAAWWTGAAPRSNLLFFESQHRVFTPTWGGDLRHGMHYGHINIWMVLAPALAVAWSRYSFHHLHYGVPRQPHTVRHEHHPMVRQSDSEDVKR